MDNEMDINLYMFKKICPAIIDVTNLFHKNFISILCFHGVCITALLINNYYANIQMFSFITTYQPLW